MGSYDGIHRGHFQILNKVNSISNQLNISSVVITFDPHPGNLIRKPKEKVKLLMSLEKKIETIKSFSIDYLVILKFDILFSIKIGCCPPESQCWILRSKLMRPYSRRSTRIL